MGFTVQVVAMAGRALDIRPRMPCISCGKFGCESHASAEMHVETVRTITINKDSVTHARGMVGPPEPYEEICPDLREYFGSARRVAILSIINVAQEDRNLGKGTQMMRRMLKEFARNKATRCFLVLSVNGDEEKLLRFYGRFGFVLFRRRPTGEVVMVFPKGRL